MEVGQAWVGMCFGLFISSNKHLLTLRPRRHRLNAVIDSLIRYTFETGLLTWYVVSFSLQAFRVVNKLASAGTVVTMICVRDSHLGLINDGARRLL
jgi:hypothetical protein